MADETQPVDPDAAVQAETAPSLAARLVQAQPHGPKPGQVALAEAVAIGTNAATITMSKS